jgi:hypothetical protein
LLLRLLQQILLEAILQELERKSIAMSENSSDKEKNVCACKFRNFGDILNFMIMFREYTGLSYSFYELGVEFRKANEA